MLIGIQPWEDKYEEMAKAMGIDPEVILLVPGIFSQHFNAAFIKQFQQESRKMHMGLGMRLTIIIPLYQ